MNLRLFVVLLNTVQKFVSLRFYAVCSTNKLSNHIGIYSLVCTVSHHNLTSYPTNYQPSERKGAGGIANTR
jgi:hypothetical protein